MFTIIKVIIVFLLGFSSLKAESLLDIYDYALHSDPTLSMANLKVKVGDAQKRQAIGVLLPQISFSGNVSMNHRKLSDSQQSSDNYKGERYTLSLTQSVIDLPKYWNVVKHGSISEQYRSEQVVAEQQLMSMVVERYFDVLEQADKLALVGQEKEATEKKSVQINQRFKKSLVKITDVLDIEAELDTIKANEIEVQTNYILTKESLSELTGRPVDKLFPLKMDIEYTEILGDIDFWIDKAKLHNPTLKAKENALEVARNSLSEHRSKHLPIVDIQLNYYITNTGFQSSLQSESETQVAAINVNVPIFSGGTTYYQGKEASYNMQISKQEHIAVLRMIVKETRDAFLATHANLRKIKSSQKSLISATKSQEAMEKGFNYGMLTLTEVLNAQTRVFKAKSDVLQAKYAYIKNKIRFKNITGDINLFSLEEINSWLDSPV